MTPSTKFAALAALLALGVHAAPSAVPIVASSAVLPSSAAASSAAVPASSAVASSAPIPASSAVASSPAVPISSAVYSSPAVPVSSAAVSSPAVPISSAAYSSAAYSSAAYSSAAYSSAALTSAAASTLAAPSAASTAYAYTSGGEVGEESGVSYTVSGTYTVYGDLVPTNPSSLAYSPTSGEPPYNSGYGTEVGWQTLSLSSYAFTPYPTASAVPEPPDYPSVSPFYPPAVENAGSTITPDFGAAWDEAFAKALAFVEGLTIPQKVNLTTGTYWEQGLCVGNIGPITEDFRGLCLQDSPLGVRYTDYNTAFPAGITVASTFNRTAMRMRGVEMGAEFRGKGVNVALGPMMNMGRVAQAGRNWEGFGTDPFLSSEAAYETVLGMQSSGVQACAKHYVDYEQEYHRTLESSEVDDRTNHEIYTKPFLRAVMAGVASVMCSYNMINDTYACENDRTLNQILKAEFGFRGYIMSDWGAQMSTLSAMSGLDMTMPGDITDGSGTSWWGPNLTAFVMNDTIPLTRLDDMATRIMAGYYLLGQDQDYPNVSFNAFDPYDEVHNLHINVQANHYELVREIGREGAILLKNTNGALPLSAPRNIALIGSDAAVGAVGPNGYTDRGGDDGLMAMGWGSGSDNFPYLVSPLEAIQARAREDGSSVNSWLLDWDTVDAADAAWGYEVALVFVNSDSGEGYIEVDGNFGDRNNLTLWHNADNLVQAVAAVNNNTIVVAHSVGPSIIEPWIEHPNVTAVIWAQVPGQEAGNSLVDVLYGDYNPSGRLPYTIAKRLEDYGVFLTVGGEANTILSVPYTEGLFYDYRHFDQYNITPRFEFGYGLSYTTFEYYDLYVDVLPPAPADATDAALMAGWDAGEPTPQGEGSSTAYWLHAPYVQVSFTVENTGAVAGTEIPQMYVHFPADSGEPPSWLKGFDAIYLEAGESQEVTFTLPRYELSVWNVDAQGWQRPPGTIALSIGASSRDFRLSGTFPI
ncbi:glycoside hydrolase family 3 protein [Wolfiporia cocos MD-104 SS10]|uniref:beta-glucosidase n=1 Tax=Wolfiporia cocos (strain MD-104) TaxID=742152 RepID=A0A2H3JKZ1_WOLCO|nr:glycoside hydrolase family 3 protein [Wolfiporia cocos MD-104 SS10]